MRKKRKPWGETIYPEREPRYKVRRAVIVSDPSGYVTGEDLIAKVFAKVFRRRGFDVYEIPSPANPPEFGDGDVAVFFWMSIPEAWWDLGGLKLLYNFHPTWPTGDWGKHPVWYCRKLERAVDLGWIDHVLDYNPQTSKAQAKAGLPTVFCPLGYDECFDFTGKAKPLTLRDTGGKDTYFIGRVKGRRNNLISKNDVAWFWGCYGEQRRRLLQTPGIHLSLRTYNRFRTCLTLRLIALLASNGRAIIHEKTDWCPLEEGRHCLVADTEELSGKIHYLRQFPEVQAQLGRQCYEYIKQHRFDASIERCLSKLIGS